MMGWSPRCYIPSFVKISLPVLEIFEGVFTIYGCGGHLGHVTQMPRTKYRSPYPRRLHIKYGFDLPSGFGEVFFEHCERRTDGRRLDGYTRSSPCEPNGSGELIINHANILTDHSKLVLGLETSLMRQMGEMQVTIRHTGLSEI